MARRKLTGMEEVRRRIAEAQKDGRDSLDLSGLRLTELPAELWGLTALTELYVSDNQLTALPAEIGRLTALTEFYVGNNGLTSLPVENGRLTELTELWIHDNRLTSLPRDIGRLRMLTMLLVTDNQLTSLPAEMRNMDALEDLYLHGNAGLGLPAEVLGPEPDAVFENRDAPAKPAEILDYYFRVRVQAATAPLNEFKLVVVGRGGVGKTSLVHKLVTSKFKAFNRTPGIDITRWPIEVRGEDVRAHVWDFGGQEIMHGTHRFFMTERALYLVLISAREGTEDRDAQYWLSMVRSFAGDVPVIVVLNKWDEQPFQLTVGILREKFGAKLEFLECDSKSGHGVGGLRRRIAELAGGLPGLRTKWPAEWRRIKEDLPNQRKNWISFEEFRDFCVKRTHDDASAANAKDRDWEQLAGYLHELGLMLSYRREEALRGFGVLNPQWVTRGIYQVLNDKGLMRKYGRFAAADLAQVLSAKKYPPNVHGYLLALMRKFELCHPLDDECREFLIPELLPKQEPEAEREFPAEKCLGFAYRYDWVLPEGLLPRFIVGTYVHAELEHSWRSGAVLRRGGCRAWVRGDVPGRTVRIRVSGDEEGRRELLGVIRQHFERLHRGYEKLPVTELIPIPGHPGAEVESKALEAFERGGRETVPVVVGGANSRFFGEGVARGGGCAAIGPARGPSREEDACVGRMALRGRTAVALYQLRA